MREQPYSDEQLMQALRERPQIRRRIEELLAVMADEGGDCRLADDAELRLTHELRLLGQDAMQSWAQGQVDATERELRNGGRAYREGKKNSAGTPRSGASA